MMSAPLLTTHGIGHAYRGRTLLRCALLLVAILVLIGPGLTAARAQGDGPARYRLRSGSGPTVLVLRHCHAEDDFGAGLRLKSYDAGRTVLVCRDH